MPTSAWTTAPSVAVTSGADAADATVAGYNNQVATADATHRIRDAYSWYGSDVFHGNSTYTNRLLGINPESNPGMNVGGTLFQYMSGIVQRANIGLCFVSTDGSGSGGIGPPIFAKPAPDPPTYNTASSDTGFVAVLWQMEIVSGGHHNLTLDLWHAAQTISLYNEQIDTDPRLGYTDADLLGFAGWVGRYDYIEFEPGLPTIDTVEVMPDWNNNGSFPGATDHVLWYAGLTRAGVTTPPNAAGWGPYERQSPGASQGWQMNGAATNPANFPAALTASMALVENYAGGASSWHTLDPTLVTAALAQEAADIAAGGFAQGIQLVALTGVNVEAHAPGAPAPDAWYGQQEVVCWTRITYTAPRFRVVLADSAPPLSPGIAPLRLFPRDDGFATSALPRNFPPPKSRQGSIRVGGGYV